MPNTGPQPGTLDKLKQAKQLIKTGVKVQDACKQVGVAYSVYYRYKHSHQTPGTLATKAKTKTYRKRVKVKMLEIPVAEPTPRLWMLYGTPLELASAMRVLL